MLVYCLYMYSHDSPWYPCRCMFLFYLISLQTIADIVAQVFIYNHIYILHSYEIYRSCFFFNIYIYTYTCGANLTWIPPGARLFHMFTPQKMPSSRRPT